MTGGWRREAENGWGREDDDSDNETKKSKGKKKRRISDKEQKLIDAKDTHEIRYHLTYVDVQRGASIMRWAGWKGSVGGRSTPPEEGTNCRMDGGGQGDDEWIGDKMGGAARPEKIGGSSKEVDKGLIGGGGLMPPSVCRP